MSDVEVDIGSTIAPNSSQLNADDLLTGPRTIVVTRVVVRARRRGSADQPVDIFFEGDEGRPYKPGLSMRRALHRFWGRDGAKYVGRSLTLYRDDGVLFGGKEIGGIRISHMSHIDGPMTMALTASKTARNLFTVQPLAGAPKKEKKESSAADRAAKAEARAAAIIAEIEKSDDVAATVKKHADEIARLTDFSLKLGAKIDEAAKKKGNATEAPDAG